jgi:hypothetical protein
VSDPVSSNDAQEALDALLKGPLRQAMKAAGVTSLNVEATSTHMYWAYSMRGHRDQVFRRAGYVDNQFITTSRAREPQILIPDCLADDDTPMHEGSEGCFILVSESVPKEMQQ